MRQVMISVLIRRHPSGLGPSGCTVQACAERLTEYSLFTPSLLFLLTSLAALPDRQATFVLFKLIVNQPAPQWSLFLRVSLLFTR